MDKKTLLGIVLVFAILFIAQNTVWKKPVVNKAVTEEAKVIDNNEIVKTEKNEIITNDVVSKEKTEVSNEKSESSEEVVPFENKIITLENNFYKVQISNDGGAVTSFILKDYENRRYSKPVDMVKAESRALGDYIDDATVKFTYADEYTEKIHLVNETSIVLNAGNYTKTFTFYPDKYNFNVEYSGEFPKNSQIGWESGVPFTEKSSKDIKQSFKAVAMLGKKMEDVGINDFKKSDTVSMNGNLKWLGVRTKYFGAFLIGEGDNAVFKGTYEKDVYDSSIAPFISLGQGDKFSFTVYAGPLKKSIMSDIEPTLVESIDIGMAWRKAISSWIFMVLAFLYSLVKNYGLAIIGLALIVKLVTLPFQHKSLKSMEEMRRLQPLMKELQEKYKDNPQKQQAELMKLYKEHNVNPLGGCLPMLLQMPVFFALYPVLKNSIELRNAHFMFWLKDLSMPDPFYILPILMGVFMFLQQKISVVDEKQKAMMYIMPVFFTIFFMNFPSGLVLYWMVFNILSIAHQLLLNKEKEKTN